LPYIEKENYNKVRQMKYTKFLLKTVLLFSTIFVLNVNFGIAQEKGKVLYDQPILMADRVSLSTDIYLPQGDGPFPSILLRTPYNKKGAKKDCEWFQSKGFAVVTQDCRGKYNSQGKFYAWINEREDGIETVKWIKAQKWSNGKIGGWGGSYVGYTQWAISDCLDVITPLVTGANVYDLIYPAGLFSLGLSFSWGLIVDAQQTNNIMPQQMQKAYSILPLSAAAEKTIGKKSQYIEDWLKHSKYDGYWQKQNHRGIAQGDVISVAGWYDIFLLDQLADFEALPQNEADRRLIILPLSHGKPTLEVDYGGPERMGDVIGISRKFMLKELTHKDIQVFTAPFYDKKYNLFIMGRNEYYGADHWPPRAVKYVDYYPASDGTLKTDIPQKNDSLSYRYDPLDPYPNLGGTAIGDGAGTALQNSNVKRKDQVFFESQTLDKPLVLLGPLNATLYVKSDVPNTDFYVCLQDVDKEGRIVNIQEGGASAAFGKSAVKELKVNIWATGYQLNPGHKLRAVICSSWFPRYNRNLNLGESIYSAKKSRVALQKIYFGSRYPSRIILPLIELKN
jgi:putative CocE/NonD family hydrolase